jgi:4-diphosphocytidyl-2-C-methyl-D-erythritol kinase
MKAVRAIQRIRSLPGLRLHLHKVIPTGAGRGGGSSDAAHTLLLLNDLLSLGLTPQQLANIAALLGSDVPFFLERRIQFAKGRGEILTPLDLDMRHCWLLLVSPGTHVSTADAYQGSVPGGSDPGLLEFIRTAPIQQWQGRVRNDLEESVLRSHPEVGAVKQRSLAAGALFAGMSGSGSSVFGLFDHRPPVIQWPPGHTAWNFQFGTGQPSSSFNFIARSR